MLRLSVLQNQWLILALLGGAAILFSTILLFVALWHPREDALRIEGGETVRRVSLGGWLRSFLPWVIILAFVAMAIFIAAYTAAAMRQPPNW